MRRLLRRCLEKDVRKRLDAGDADLLLDDGKEDAPPASVSRVPPARSLGLAALALAAMVALAAGGWWLGRRGGTRVERLVSRLTFSRGMMPSARFAPDGQTIVYSAAWGGPPIKLYLARIESPEATPMALPPGELLSISKTGELAVALGFEYAGWMGDGTLSRTSLLGGSPREILEHVRVADWSPAGSEFAIRTIPNPDGIGYESLPAWLPDGKRFVVAGRHGTEESRAYLVDAASGSAKPFGAEGLFWNDFGQPPVSPDGTFAVFRDKDGKALRWPIDGGAPLPIPGIAPADAPLAWTDDGAALYVGGSSVPIQISRLDLTSGRRTPWKTIAPDDASGLRYLVVSITPDGEYWALSVAKLLTDLYLVDGLR